MRVLIIPAGAPAVSAYRFAQPAWQMNDAHVTQIPEFPEQHPDAWLRSFAEWFVEQDKFDIVWTNNYSATIAAVLDFCREKHGSEIVADVDDLFDEVPDGNPAHMSWFGERKLRYRSMLDDADRVVASTPYLAGRYGGSLCPNYIDRFKWNHPRRFDLKPDQCILTTHRRPNEVVICMPKGNGRAGDYLMIEKALRAALEIDGVRVLCMGSIPYWAMEYSPKKITWCSWVPYQYYPRIMRLISPDIIISPMEHHNFNLAKSNLKWLEAGASGACFMGERWGEYSRTVVDGSTGVLADSVDEWTEKLVWLCQNHDVRQKIAENGRREVLQEWTWPAVKDLWVKGVMGHGSRDGGSVRRPDEQHHAAAAG